MPPLASVAAAIIMVLGGDFSSKGIAVAQGVAIPLAAAGLLTMIVRTLSSRFGSRQMLLRKKETLKELERAHFIAFIARSTYCYPCSTSFDDSC